MSGLHFRAEFALNFDKNHKSAIRYTWMSSRSSKLSDPSAGLYIRVCGLSGIPMRFHRDENNTANFNFLVVLIGKFNTEVEKYLGSEKKVKFLSQIQNQVVRVLVHTLMRGLLDHIQADSIGSSSFYV